MSWEFFCSPDVTVGEEQLLGEFLVVCVELWLLPADYYPRMRSTFFSAASIFNVTITRYICVFVSRMCVVLPIILRGYNTHLSHENAYLSNYWHIKSGGSTEKRGRDLWMIRYLELAFFPTCQWDSSDPLRLKTTKKWLLTRRFTFKTFDTGNGNEKNCDKRQEIYKNGKFEASKIYFSHIKTTVNVGRSSWWVSLKKRLTSSQSVIHFIIGSVWSVCSKYVSNRTNNRFFSKTNFLYFSIIILPVH